MNLNGYDFKDEYGEILLRKAAILSAEEDKKIYDKLHDDESIVNPNQKELDKKILSMIKKYEKGEKRKHKLRILKKVTTKVAIFIAIFTIGFLITFTTVDAFKITVINFFIEQREKFSLISLTENNNRHIPSELSEKYYPRYLPEGYKIANTYVNDDKVGISYVDKNNEIINYDYFGINAAASIDTEDRTETSVLINNFQGHIYSKNGHNLLVFNTDKYIFVIGGFISQDEIIKMAESIKK